MKIADGQQQLRGYDYARIDRRIRALADIYLALEKGRYAEAAIRISHAGLLSSFPNLLSIGNSLRKTTIQLRREMIKVGGSVLRKVLSASRFIISPSLIRSVK